MVHRLGSCLPYLQVGSMMDDRYKRIKTHWGNYENADQTATSPPVACGFVVLWQCHTAERAPHVPTELFLMTVLSTLQTPVLRHPQAV